MNQFMPKGYVADNGKIKAVKVIQVRLADPDEHGFCAPVEIPGKILEIEVDLVVEALGQKPPDNLNEIVPGVELTEDQLIVVGPNDHRTNRQGVFAGGDIVNGGITVVQAVADGLAAAEEIDSFLLGKDGKWKKKSL